MRLRWYKEKRSQELLNASEMVLRDFVERLGTKDINEIMQYCEDQGYTNIENHDLLKQRFLELI